MKAFVFLGLLAFPCFGDQIKVKDTKLIGKSGEVIGHKIEGDGFICIETGYGLDCQFKDKK